MKLEMLPVALDAYRHIKESDPGKAANIKAMLEDSLSRPERGKGNPIRLEGDFKNLWQRTLRSGEKIVYQVNGDVLLILSVVADGLSAPFKIEEYPQAYDVILKEFDLPPEKTTAKYAIHWDIGQTWR